MLQKCRKTVAFDASTVHCMNKNQYYLIQINLTQADLSCTNPLSEIKPKVSSKTSAKHTTNTRSLTRVWPKNRYNINTRKKIFEVPNQSTDQELQTIQEMIQKGIMK